MSSVEPPVSATQQGRSAGSPTLLLILSAVAFSTAGVFTRQAPVGLAAMVFWRNLFGIVGLLLIWTALSRSAARLEFRLGGSSWIVVCSSALGTLCYLAAFAHTSVANVSILYATAPLMTAMLAWVSLREPVSWRTLGAALAALIGVAVTVNGSFQAGHAIGDMLALAMTASLSIMAVAARKAASPALPTTLLSSGLAALIILPLARTTGGSFVVSWTEAAWLAGFGLVTMTVALPCYLIGAAGVPAGRAMLISALEMPLAPIWVWLANGEVPSTASLIGGTLVTAAILSDLVGHRGGAAIRPSNSPG